MMSDTESEIFQHLHSVKWNLEQVKTQQQASSEIIDSLYSKSVIMTVDSKIEVLINRTDVKWIDLGIKRRFCPHAFYYHQPSKTVVIARLNYSGHRELQKLNFGPANGLFIATEELEIAEKIKLTGLNLKLIYVYMNDYGHVIMIDHSALVGNPVGITPVTFFDKSGVGVKYNRWTSVTKQSLLNMIDPIGYPTPVIEEKPKKKKKPPAPIRRVFEDPIKNSIEYIEDESRMLF